MSLDPNASCMTTPKKSVVGIFGAALDTQNLGVSALCTGAVAGILRSIPDAEVYVFDHGRGLRTTTLEFDGQDWPINLCGASHSRRFYRAESIAGIRVRSKLGLRNNPTIKILQNASAILDVTGGDSFTDLYGQRVFDGGLLRKQLVLESGTPLILLPQTYGPFKNKKNEINAARIIKAAGMAWARDKRSFEILKKLLGDDFDPKRHRVGTDLAFGLSTVEPKVEMRSSVEKWMDDRGQSPLIAINVSGLIYNQPTAAEVQYGFKIDYARVLQNLIERFVTETSGKVLLVPHVVTDKMPESDGAAASALVSKLPESIAKNVSILPPDYSHEEIRWFLAKTDWFLGTRMHSTIAAISAGVPTATICYSDKAQGVFDSCGLGDTVIDPRIHEEETVFADVWSAWEDRKAAQGRIDEVMPTIRQQALDQMKVISDFTLGGMNSLT